MLLTDKNAIIININDKPIEVVVNFKILENLTDKETVNSLKSQMQYTAEV